MRYMLMCTQVVEVAEKYFGWASNGSVLAWDAELAVSDMLEEEEPPLYDHIIHDVFSGQLRFYGVVCCLWM